MDLPVSLAPALVVNPTSATPALAPADNAAPKSVLVNGQSFKLLLSKLQAASLKEQNSLGLSFENARGRNAGEKTAPNLLDLLTPASALATLLAPVTPAQGGLGEAKTALDPLAAGAGSTLGKDRSTSLLAVLAQLSASVPEAGQLAERLTHLPGSEIGQVADLIKAASETDVPSTAPHSFKDLLSLQAALSSLGSVPKEGSDLNQGKRIGLLAQAAALAAAANAGTPGDQNVLVPGTNRVGTFASALAHAIKVTPETLKAKDGGEAALRAGKESAQLTETTPTGTTELFATLSKAVEQLTPVQTPTLVSHKTVSLEQMVHTLAAAISEVSDNGVSQLIKIQLDPPQLGRVEVTVRRDSAGIGVRIQAEQAGTQAHLLAMSASLSDTLKASTSEKVTVHIPYSPPQQQHNDQRQDRPDQKEREDSSVKLVSGKMYGAAFAQLLQTGSSSLSAYGGRN